LVASAFEGNVGVAGGGVVVDVDVGGTEVLVEVGMGVVLGVLAGTEVPQADEIKTRTIAIWASRIFFIFPSLLKILIFAETDLKKRVLTPTVSIYRHDYRNPDKSK